MLNFGRYPLLTSARLSPTTRSGGSFNLATLSQITRNPACTSLKDPHTALGIGWCCCSSAATCRRPKWSLSSPRVCLLHCAEFSWSEIFSTRLSSLSNLSAIEVTSLCNCPSSAILLDWQTAASNTGDCSLTTAAACRGTARAQTYDPRAVTAARDPNASGDGCRNYGPSLIASQN